MHNKVSKILFFVLLASMTFAAGGREFTGNTIFGHVVNLPDVAIYNIEFMIQIFKRHKILFHQLFFNN